MELMGHRVNHAVRAGLDEKATVVKGDAKMTSGHIDISQ
jgi:hypothetical protein